MNRLILSLLGATLAGTPLAAAPGGGSDLCPARTARSGRAEG